MSDHMRIPRRLEQLLSCDFCYSTYCADYFKLQPTELSCGHIFCSGCVWQLTSRSGIRCPECGEQSPLPRVGYFPVDEGLLFLLQQFPASNGCKTVRRRPQFSPSLSTIREEDSSDSSSETDELLKMVQSATSNSYKPPYSQAVRMTADLHPPPTQPQQPIMPPIYDADLPSTSAAAAAAAAAGAKKVKENLRNLFTSLFKKFD